MDLLKKGNVGRMLKSVSLEAKGEIKMTKKILAVVLGVVMLAGVAKADSPKYFNLTVTCEPALSVWVGASTYGFGSVGANTASLATTSLAVINDSDGRTEKYSVAASDAQHKPGAATPKNWDLADTAAADVYTLSAKFNTVQPADFEGGNFELTNAAITCNGTLLAGDQTGNDIAADTQNDLWFRIKTPTTVTDIEEHTIYVTITALTM